MSKKTKLRFHDVRCFLKHEEYVKLWQLKFQLEKPFPIVIERAINLLFDSLNLQYDETLKMKKTNETNG